MLESRAEPQTIVSVLSQRALFRSINRDGARELCFLKGHLLPFPWRSFPDRFGLDSRQC